MADLKSLALKLATQGPHKVLPASPRLIQVLFNGTYVIKTTKASFVWEHPFYPQLYFPAGEFSSKEIKITEGEKYTSEGKDVATQWILKVGDRSTDKIIKFSDNLTGPAESLSGHVKVDFKAMDHWFEESTPIFVHPKDPFKRIDILSSTRPIKIRVGGQLVAETTTSMHLYETGLPVRFYIPLLSVDPKVLRRSQSGTVTECPYKGKAEYYDVVLGSGEVWENVVWYYDSPLLESAKVEGLVCFYNEKVEIELDGQVLETPKTHFAPPKGK